MKGLPTKCPTWSEPSTGSQLLLKIPPTGLLVQSQQRQPPQEYQGVKVVLSWSPTKSPSRSPSTTTTPSRRSSLLCLIGFCVSAVLWCQESTPLSFGLNGLGKLDIGLASPSRTESGHLEPLRPSRSAQRSTSSCGHLDFLAPLEFPQPRTFSGLPGDWRAATSCAIPSHPWQRHQLTVKEQAFGSLHSTNGDDSNVFPRGWTPQDDDLRMAIARAYGPAFLLPSCNCPCSGGWNPTGTSWTCSCRRSFRAFLCLGGPRHGTSGWPIHQSSGPPLGLRRGGFCGPPSGPGGCDPFGLGLESVRGPGNGLSANPRSSSFCRAFPGRGPTCHSQSSPGDRTSPALDFSPGRGSARFLLSPGGASSSHAWRTRFPPSRAFAQRQSRRAKKGPSTEATLGGSSSRASARSPLGSSEPDPAVGKVGKSTGSDGAVSSSAATFDSSRPWTFRPSRHSCDFSPESLEPVSSSPAKLCPGDWSPPRTRQPTMAPTNHLRQLPEDEPVDLQGEVDGAPMDQDLSQHPYAEALLQQSRALVSLVSHLHAASTDPLSELTGSSSGVGVKGAAGRERLQHQLSQQNGQFFLKVCQAMHRRQSPTTAPPDSLDSLGNLGLITYLERYGGFGAHRELGLIMWSVAHIFDAARDNNMGAVRDYTALLAVMIEQANMDNNQWGVAWMLGLLEDPPHTLWMNRGTSATGGKRALAPLCNQQWATTALAVIKEQEVLASKRAEASNPRPKAAGGELSPDPKSKNRPRPKRKPGANEPSGSTADPA